MILNGEFFEDGVWWPELMVGEESVSSGIEEERMESSCLSLLGGRRCRQRG